MPEPLTIDNYGTIRDHLLPLIDGHVQSMRAFKAHPDSAVNDYIKGQLKYHQNAISALTHAIKTAKQRIARGSYERR